MSPQKVDKLFESDLANSAVTSGVAVSTNAQELIVKNESEDHQEMIVEVPRPIMVSTMVEMDMRSTGAIRKRSLSGTSRMNPAIGNSNEFTFKLMLDADQVEQMTSKAWFKQLTSNLGSNKAGSSSTMARENHQVAESRVRWGTDPKTVRTSSLVKAGELADMLASQKSAPAPVVAERLVISPPAYKQPKTLAQTSPSARQNAPWTSKEQFSVPVITSPPKPMVELNPAWLLPLPSTQAKVVSVPPLAQQMPRLTHAACVEIVLYGLSETVMARILPNLPKMQSPEGLLNCGTKDTQCVFCRDLGIYVPIKGTTYHHLCVSRGPVALMRSLETEVNFFSATIQVELRIRPQPGEIGMIRLKCRIRKDTNTIVYESFPDFPAPRASTAWDYQLCRDPTRLMPTTNNLLAFHQRYVNRVAMFELTGRRYFLLLDPITELSEFLDPDDIRQLVSHPNYDPVTNLSDLAEAIGNHDPYIFKMVKSFESGQEHSPDKMFRLSVTSKAESPGHCGQTFCISAFGATSRPSLASFELHQQLVQRNPERDVVHPLTITYFRDRKSTVAVPPFVQKGGPVNAGARWIRNREVLINLAIRRAIEGTPAMPRNTDLHKYRVPYDLEVLETFDLANVDELANQMQSWLFYNDANVVTHKVIPEPVLEVLMNTLQYLIEFQQLPTIASKLNKIEEHRKLTASHPGLQIRLPAPDVHGNYDREEWSTLAMFACWRRALFDTVPKTVANAQEGYPNGQAIKYWAMKMTSEWRGAPVFYI